MKTNSSLSKFLFRTLTGVLIFISGCYQFDFVIQPHSAELNSSFEVQISVTMNDWRNNYENYIGYFGIQLPDDWTVNDSIQYVSDTNMGYFIYSNEMTLQISNDYPPEDGYKWWAAESSDSVMYVLDDTFLFNPEINTSDTPGNYHITYLISDSYNGISGDYGNIWSYNNYITVGLPDLVEVTNNNDSGLGSLRSAIDSVDFYGTITFDLDADDTLILESQINLYKDIQIIGNENQPIILSGNDTTRIFNIESGRSPVLSNLVITKGKTGNQQPFYDGGGIYVNSNASPAFNNLLICDNYASRAGGGIYFARNCTAYLENLTIVNNVAEIYYGGGIAAWNCDIIFDSINRCNIYDNISSAGKDILFSNDNTIFLDTFSVLYPTTYYIAGNSEFSYDINYGKHEQVDSDLYVSPDGDDNNNGFTPENPLKRINKAISLLRADSLHRNTIHLLNGVYSKSSNEECFPLFLPNYIDLEGESAEDVIINSYEGSQRLTYGPISLAGNSDNNISKLTLKGGYYSGGITMNNSSPLLNNLIICENYGTGGQSGIYCNNSNPTIKNTIIYNNSGNGIYLYNSDAYILNTKINNNVGSIYGGGIYCENSNPLLEEVTFNNNRAHWGGGIYLRKSNPIIKNSLIENNKAYEGGGIYCAYSSNPIIENVRIIDNDATYENGGGLYVYSGSNPTLKNVVIAGNYAKGVGGGIFCSGSNASLTNVTISDNKGKISCGAFYGFSSNSTFTNSILWNNEPEEIYFDSLGGWNTVSLGWTNIEDGIASIETNNNGIVNWLEGNIDNNPMFVMSGDYPYQINDYSPCIDAGTPDTSGLNLPQFDLAGNLRIMNEKVDMGAYEWNMFVGVEEPVFDEPETANVTIYPNPATSTATLNGQFASGETLNICIYNTSGSCLKSYEFANPQTGQQEFTLDLSNLRSGIYFLRLQAGNEVVTKKIVKL